MLADSRPGTAQSPPIPVVDLHVDIAYQHNYQGKPFADATGQYRASELVAAGRTCEEVGKLIGADWLIYQDLEDLIAACRHDDSQVTEFDTSCFSGEYVTGEVTPEYLERLRLERSDAAKKRQRERRGPLKVVGRS